MVTRITNFKIRNIKVLNCEKQLKDHKESVNLPLLHIIIITTYKVMQMS